MSQAWPGLSFAPVAGRGVAVLVDGENIPQSAADDVLRRAEALGPLVTLRVFCNRLNPNGWDADPRFQVVYVHGIAGKNSVDIRMVIDALDIANGHAVDAFVLVSTDRDFAPLAHRLRDPGFRVLGMGRAETSDQFRLACSEFHVIGARNAAPQPVVAKTEILAVKPAPKPKPALSKIDAAVHSAIHAHGTRDNEIGLQALGTLMKQGYSMTCKDIGSATWRKYFLSKPDLYTLTPQNAVRLRQA